MMERYERLRLSEQRLANWVVDVITIAYGWPGCLALNIKCHSRWLLFKSVPLKKACIASD